MDRSAWLRVVARGAKAALTFFASHWGKIAAATVLVMVWSPSTYRLAIDRLPSAYYKVASLGNPPRWDSLPSYNIDFAPVDNGNRRDRVKAFIEARDQIVRLGGNLYIPGRGDPRSDGIERPGKTWEAPACLLVDEVLFRAVDRWAYAKRDANGGIARDEGGRIELDFDNVPIDPELTPIAVMTASQIKATYGGAERYVAGLNRGLVKQSCIGPGSSTLEDRLLALESDPSAADKREPLCPRVEVWFYGAVAPCSIRPF
jgi:hypothetical protein